MHENNSESQNQAFLILVNEEEQYSLWSDGIAVPKGWSVKYGPAPKDACLQYVEEVWTDITPKSVRLRISDVV